MWADAVKKDVAALKGTDRTKDKYDLQDRVAQDVIAFQRFGTLTAEEQKIVAGASSEAARVQEMPGPGIVDKALLGWEKAGKGEIDLLRGLGKSVGGVVGAPIGGAIAGLGTGVAEGFKKSLSESGTGIGIGAVVVLIIIVVLIVKLA